MRSTLHLRLARSRAYWTSPVFVLTLCWIALSSACSSNERRRAEGLDVGNDVGFNPLQGGPGGQGGAGLDLCSDVKCPASSECVVEEGEASCQCTGQECEVLDCDANPCDENANCRPTNSGFTCTCTEGYSGNGFTCTEGDPCEGFVCATANTECRTDGLSAYCLCADGFEQDTDGTCVDVDECADGSADCGLGGLCWNLPGSYVCDCKEGYATAEDFSCIAIDECRSEQNACTSVGSECIDYGDGYECSCSGLAATVGNHCKLIPDCTAATCDNDGLCIERVEGFQCGCPLGTTGATCQNIGKCSKDRVLNSSTNPLIEDPVVRARIEALLGVTPGEPVVVGDLEYLDELIISAPESSGAEVSSLKGLECWTNLAHLSLRNHNVSDLKPLQHLGLLTSLDLTCNPLTDLSVLGHNSTLKSLTLDQGNHCSHPAQLNDLNDVGTFPLLEELSLAGQGIDDPEPLNSLYALHSLNLAHNPLTSLASLDGMPTLRELSLEGTMITELAVLSHFERLRYLNLTDSALTTLNGIDELSELRQFFAARTSLQSLAPLATARLLRELDVSDNEISNLAPLAELTVLLTIEASGNQISDLSPLLESPSTYPGRVLNVLDNPLHCEEAAATLATLEKRGLSAVSDCD